MKRILISLAVVGALGVAACRDTTTAAPTSRFAIAMASAFSTTPAGYGNLSSSFADQGTDAFMPSFDGMGGPGMGMGGGPGMGPGRHDGFDGFGPGPGFGIGLMGGGLGGPFLGDIFPRPHPDSACAYANGIVTCSEGTHGGLTVTRTFALTNAAGQPQQTVDSTTNTITATTAVSGTVTRRDSSTSTISETSAQTVTGLAAGSANLTVNGASAGSESTKGNSPNGAFTALRVTGDTIKGLVVPARTSAAAHYPTAGTVIRAMSVTVTVSGQSPAVSTRREVVTYDGSSAAKVVITHDDSTQTCTQPLPHGRLVCQ